MRARFCPNPLSDERDGGDVIALMSQQTARHDDDDDDDGPQTAFLAARSVYYNTKYCMIMLRVCVLVVVVADAANPLTNQYAAARTART